jgi:hypothetical protein
LGCGGKFDVELREEAFADEVVEVALLLPLVEDGGEQGELFPDLSADDVEDLFFEFR